MIGAGPASLSRLAGPVFRTTPEERCYDPMNGSNSKPSTFYET